MISLLDHLTALGVGTIVLVALLSLQTRDRIAEVEGTVTDVASGQAGSVAETLAEEFENVLSPAMAQAATGTARYRLERDAANERTVLVEVPAYVRTAPGGPPLAAHVRYTLVATGPPLRVGTRSFPVYQLRRAVDRGTGYGAPVTVGEQMLDFDVKFRGRTDERFAGAPPVAFAQIAFQVVVGVTAPPAASGARTRQTNRVRASATIRPANLTPTA